MSVLTVLGRRIEQSPPNTRRADTRIMGMEQWTSTSSPKIRFPKIAANLPTPVCIPMEVDLKEVKLVYIFYV